MGHPGAVPPLNPVQEGWISKGFINILRPDLLGNGQGGALYLVLRLQHLQYVKVVPVDGEPQLLPGDHVGGGGRYLLEVVSAPGNIPKNRFPGAAGGFLPQADPAGVIEPVHGPGDPGGRISFFVLDQLYRTCFPPVLGYNLHRHPDCRSIQGEGVFFFRQLIAPGGFRLL